jgi:hypothetical protein
MYVEVYMGRDEFEKLIVRVMRQLGHVSIHIGDVELDQWMELYQRWLEHQTRLWIEDFYRRQILPYADDEGL